MIKQQLMVDKDLVCVVICTTNFSLSLLAFNQCSRTRFRSRFRSIEILLVSVNFGNFAYLTTRKITKNVAVKEALTPSSDQSSNLDCISNTGNPNIQSNLDIKGKKNRLLRMTLPRTIR